MRACYTEHLNQVYHKIQSMCYWIRFRKYINRRKTTFSVKANRYILLVRWPDSLTFLGKTIQPKWKHREFNNKPVQTIEIILEIVHLNKSIEKWLLNLDQWIGEGQNISRKKTKNTAPKRIQQERIHFAWQYYSSIYAGMLLY